MNISDEKTMEDSSHEQVGQIHRAFRRFIRGAHFRAWLILVLEALLRAVAGSAGLAIVLFSTRSISGLSPTLIAGIIATVGFLLFISTVVAHRDRVREFIAVVDDHYDAAGRLVAAREFLKDSSSNDAFRNIALQDAARWVANHRGLGLPWTRSGRWQKASMALATLLLVFVIGCSDPAVQSEEQRTDPDLDIAPPGLSQRHDDHATSDTHTSEKPTAVMADGGIQHPTDDGRSSRNNGESAFKKGSGLSSAKTMHGDGKNGDSGTGAGKDGTSRTGSGRTRASANQGDRPSDGTGASDGKGNGNGSSAGARRPQSPAGQGAGSHSGKGANGDKGSRDGNGAGHTGSSSRNGDGSAAGPGRVSASRGDSKNSNATPASGKGSGSGKETSRSQGTSGKRNGEGSGSRTNSGQTKKSLQKSRSNGKGGGSASKSGQSKGASKGKAGKDPPKTRSAKVDRKTTRKGGRSAGKTGSKIPHKHDRKISAARRDVKSQHQSNRGHSTHETSEGIDRGDQFAVGRQSSPTSRPVGKINYALPRPDDLAIERIPPSRRALIKRYYENLRALSRKNPGTDRQATSQPTTRPARKRKSP